MAQPVEAHPEPACPRPPQVKKQPPAAGGDTNTRPNGTRSGKRRHRPTKRATSSSRPRTSVRRRAGRQKGDRPSKGGTLAETRPRAAPRATLRAATVGARPAQGPSTKKTDSQPNHNRSGAWWGRQPNQLQRSHASKPGPGPRRRRQEGEGQEHRARHPTPVLSLASVDAEQFIGFPWAPVRTTQAACDQEGPNWIHIGQIGRAQDFRDPPSSAPLGYARILILVTAHNWRHLRASRAINVQKPPRASLRGGKPRRRNRTGRWTQGRWDPGPVGESLWDSTKGFPGEGPPFTHGTFAQTSCSAGLQGPLACPAGSDPQEAYVQLGKQCPPPWPPSTPECPSAGTSTRQVSAGGGSVEVVDLVGGADQGPDPPREDGAPGGTPLQPPRKPPGLWENTPLSGPWKTVFKWWKCTQQPDPPWETGWDPPITSTPKFRPPPRRRTLRTRG